MLNRQFLTFVGIGLVVVAIALGITLWGTKGSHLQLEGKILKVRTLATDDKNSMVVVDFRVTNQSRLNFVVEDATVVVTTPEGKVLECDPVARQDVNRVMDYYRMLGPKYNETLIQRDKVAGGRTMDRMIAAAVPLTEQDLEKRKGLAVRLHDVDGPTFDLIESKR
jgi:hypothetical protein